VKKLFGFFLMVTLALALVACGNGGEETPPVDTEPTTTNTASISGATEVTITVGDEFNHLTGVSAMDTETGDITSSMIVEGLSALNTNAPGNYTLTYKVTGSDGNLVTVTRLIIVLTAQGCGVHEDLVNGICVKRPATVIRIMHGAPYEVDPFHANYTGTQQQAKQEKQNQVEAQFNVDILYVPYPSNAPWGPDRVEAIIQSSISGNHLADIYWSVSDWIQRLAVAEAIVPVDKYLATHGSNIRAGYREVGEFRGQVYGFESGLLTVSSGLYYNADLVAALGVQNPTQMFLDGNWNWTTFEAWAQSVKTALTSLGGNRYALGGMPSEYAEHMVPLNGGSLINKNTGRVAFAQNPALETYTFLSSIYTKGLFEPTPAYDAGSPDWMAGNVAMYPGQLWFLTADNRWGQLPFELGFVPYPKSPTYTGGYASPISGVAVYHVASGMTAAKEELVFRVWNELQMWKTDAGYETEFENTLITKFDQAIYVEAYLEIYDKIYLDLINAVGIGSYGEYGWRRNINLAIREGTARTVMDSIKPIYDAALEDYLGK
jgi:maltose-binding protein MalE